MDSTFVLPGNWFQAISGKTFEVGHSLQVSRSCNPNFIWNCDDHENYDDACNSSVAGLFYYSNLNTNGHLETFLQCPQCGCGSEGAANLMDLYAAELEGSRTVLDDANSMYNITVNM